MQISYPIIFFDGKCSLCNKSIDLIISLDKKRAFRYAPLQGEAAIRLLPLHTYTLLSSLVYYENGKIWTKSEAIIKVLSKLGFPFFILGKLITIIPKSLLNLIYDYISQNRIRWFGQSESCRMPTKEERVLFLD